MKRVLLPAALLFTASISHAALTWTGGGNGISLYAENNWQDDGGGQPAAGTIDAGAAVTAATGGSVEITGGTGTPSNYGGAFIMASGDDLTISNGKNLASSGGSAVTGGGTGSTLTVSNGSNLGVGPVSAFEGVVGSNATITLAGGLTGLTSGSSLSVSGGTNFVSSTVTDFSSVTVDGSTIDLTGTAGFQMAVGISTFAITNGGSVIAQFIAKGADITVDGTSSVQFLGGGDPINSQVEDTHVLLSTGGQLILPNAAEIDEQIGEGDIYVNGTLVTLVNRDSLLSITGGTATGIPEPATALLGAFGLLALLRRRRA